MLKFKLWWENGKQQKFWINDKKLWDFIEMKLEISKILIALKKRLIESWIGNISCEASAWVSINYKNTPWFVSWEEKKNAKLFYR